MRFYRNFAIKLLSFRFMISILQVRNVPVLLRFAIMRYLLRRQIPGVATLALTYRCPCRCEHCSAGAYEVSSGELSVLEWKNVIDQLGDLGVPRVHLSGGEPTLKEGFEEIVRHACGKGMLVFFETNGYNLNEETMIRLKKHGLSSIDVSLDNADPLAHDRLRNWSGSFDKAIEILSFCRKLDIPHMVSTYATKETIYSGELLNVIGLSKKLKATALRVLPPQPSGRWLAKDGLRLDAKDVSFLRNHYPVYPILDRLTLPLCPIKSKYSVFVGPDGEIHPCPHLPFSFGNIRQGSIADAIERMANDRMFASKSICFINEADFRNEFIIPLLGKRIPLPMRR